MFEVLADGGQHPGRREDDSRVILPQSRGMPLKSMKKELTAVDGIQKFPADPKTNWSGHSCSFQLAKTLPQTNLHW